MKEGVTIIERAFIVIVAGVLTIGVPPAQAQHVAGSQAATSTVGRVGQRQTGQDAAVGIEPMARINSRIQNRIQSRLRTRIDRDYNSGADTLSPFETAADQARTSGRPRQR